MLRISTNYLQKVFKRGGEGGRNKETMSFGIEKEEEKEERYDEEDEDDDELYRVEENRKRKSRKKKEQETQKFPSSRQFIDLELMRFGLLMFEGSI